MNFLALQLFEEETKQPLRVSLNPRYIVTVMAYTVEDQYILVEGDRRTPTHAVSITFELHHENVIDLLLPQADAQMLIACLHKQDWYPDQVFNDIRNQIEHDDEE